MSAPAPGPEILVLTRPAEAAEVGTPDPRVHALPLLSLHTVPASPALEALLDAARGADIQICLSAQAARALATLRADFPRQCRPDVRWFAVGAATAAELRQRLGVSARCPAAGARDSEGLLALLGPVQACTVAIHTAPEGRELLPVALQSAGANVLQLAVYARAPRWPTPEELAALSALPAPLLFSATSLALLAQLQQLLPTLKRSAAQTALVVPAERIAQAARAAGFVDVRLATGAAVPELKARLR